MQCFRGTEDICCHLAGNDPVSAMKHSSELTGWVLHHLYYSLSMWNIHTPLQQELTNLTTIMTQDDGVLKLQSWCNWIVKYSHMQTKAYYYYYYTSLLSDIFVSWLLTICCPLRFPTYLVSFLLYHSGVFAYIISTQCFMSICLYF